MEKIGDAYVRVILQGEDGPRRGLRDLFRRVRKDAERAGNDVSSDYWRSFNDASADAEVRAARRMSRNVQYLASKNFRDMGRRVGDTFGENVWRGVNRRLRRDFASGRLELPDPWNAEDADEYQAQMGAFFDRLIKLRQRYIAQEEDEFTKHREREFNDLRKHLARQAEERRKAQARETAERVRHSLATARAEHDRNQALLRARRQQQREELADLLDYYRRIDDLEKERTRTRIEELARQVGEERRARDVIERDWMESYRRLQNRHRQLIAGNVGDHETWQQATRRTRAHYDELIRAFDRLDLRSRHGFGQVRRDLEAMGRDVDINVVRFRRWDSRIARFARISGRAFGRGARNDVIHFFGGLVQGMLNVGRLVPRFGQWFAEGAQRFSAMQTAGTGLMGTVRNLGSAFLAGGKGFGSFISALASAGLAMSAIAVVAGVLVASLSMLLGIITALAATITMALIGSLVAVAGAIAPVALGIGVLAGAIAAMDDNMKAALSNAIKPFVEGMKDLGREAANVIFGGERFQTTIRDMASAINSSGMRRLVLGVADAIGDIGASWAKSLNSPGFQAWLNAMTRTVPDQLRALGRVIENIAVGMGNTLLAAQPLVDRFIGWLERITEKWREWTSSNEGQQRMLDFFEKAGDSASALGGFIREISGLLKDLFLGGQDTGDSLFESMTRAVERFRKYIADGGLEQWFEDAKDFAYDLGETLEQLGRIIDTLDGAFNRIASSGIVQLIGGLFELINATGAAQGAIGMFWDWLNRLAEALGGWSGIWDSIVQGFLAFGPLITGVFDNIGIMASTTWTGITTAAQAMWDELTYIATTLGEWFSQTWTAIQSGAQTAWTGIQTSAQTAWSDIQAKAESMRNGVQTALSTLASYASGRWDNMRQTASTAFDRIRSGASAAWDRIRDGAERMGSVIGRVLGRIPNPLDAIRSAAAAIARAFDSVVSAARRVADAIRRIPRPPSLSSLNPFSASGSILLGEGTIATARKMAAGGRIGSLTNYRGVTVAEAGPEAIVPLSRPLGQVDPSVRMLSAFAQGKLRDLMGNTGPKVEANNWVIQTPGDPEAAANEILNRIAGRLT